MADVLTYSTSNTFNKQHIQQAIHSTNTFNKLAQVCLLILNPLFCQWCFLVINIFENATFLTNINFSAQGQD